MAIEPSGGMKSDRAERERERLKRQRRASKIKFYIFAIVLGGLLGLAVVKRDAIISAYNSVMNPPPPPKPQAPVVPPEPKVAEKVPPVAPMPKNQDATPPVAPKPSANVIVEPPVSPRDEAEVRSLLAGGKAALETFDFATATKRFDGATKFKVGKALKDEVSTWQRKSVEFFNATKHIAVADYAQGENAVLIETEAGDERRGLKLKETEDVIYLQAANEANPAAEGIQKYPIPKSEIKKITPIPLAKRRAEFSELVLSAESATSISHSTDYYDLVYLSRRLGMGKECMMYLNRAFDGGPGHAADPNLGDSFRSVVVRRVIGRATLLMAGNRRTQVEIELKKLKDTLPGFEPAETEIAAFRSQVMDKVKADFQPSLVVNDKKPEPKKSTVAAADSGSKSKQPVRDDSVEVVVDNSMVKSSGAAGSVVDKANAKFEDGMRVIRTYQVGVGGNKNDNNKILSQAKVLLLEAIDLYEDAIKLEPGNKGLRDRQQTASQMIYFCNKNMIL